MALRDGFDAAEREEARALARAAVQADLRRAFETIASDDAGDEAIVAALARADGLAVAAPAAPVSHTTTAVVRRRFGGPAVVATWVCLAIWPLAVAVGMLGTLGLVGGYALVFLSSPLTAAVVARARKDEDAEVVRATGVLEVDARAVRVGEITVERTSIEQACVQPLADGRAQVVFARRGLADVVITSDPSSARGLVVPIVFGAKFARASFQALPPL